MTLHSILSTQPIIPVVVVDDIPSALQLAQLLMEEDIPIMEITLRRANALKIIKEIHNNFPTMTIAAGTIRHPEQIASALQAGAEFCVSPGISTILLDEAKRLAVNLLPGVATASDILLGEPYGLTYYKLFPAVPINGLALLKAFASPFSDLKFCPTGGISQDNYLDYLQQPNVVAVGCSWFCSSELIANNAWDEIRTRIQLLKHEAVGNSVWKNQVNPTLNAPASP